LCIKKDLDRGGFTSTARKKTYGAREDFWSSDRKSLSVQDAQRPLKAYGYCELESRKYGWIPIFPRPIKNPLFVIPLTYTIVSGFLVTIDLTASGVPMTKKG
jgi:hypothetical protein